MFSFAVCRLELIYRESVGITEQAVWCAHSISCWLESARISTCAVSARATGVWPFPITGESLGFHCLFLQEFFAGHCNISLLWHHCRWLPFQRKHTNGPIMGFFMRQWKSVKGALFVSSLSDVLELGCLFDLGIVVHISPTQYSGPGVEGKKRINQKELCCLLWTVWDQMWSFLSICVNLWGDKDSGLLYFCMWGRPSWLRVRGCSLRQIIDLLDVTLSEHPSLGFSTRGIDADTSASELFKQRAGRQGDAAVNSWIHLHANRLIA